MSKDTWKQNVSAQYANKIEVSRERGKNTDGHKKEEEDWDRIRVTRNTRRMGGKLSSMGKEK